MSCLTQGTLQPGITRTNRHVEIAIRPSGPLSGLFAFNARAIEQDCPTAKAQMPVAAAIRRTHSHYFYFFSVVTSSTLLSWPYETSYAISSPLKIASAGLPTTSYGLERT
jgi:hypothetical protein